MHPRERDETGLRALRHLAAAIGADPRLVQGAGGNVSLKSADTMWIKASGTWLADAESQEILVPVRLSPGTADKFEIPAPGASALRPSIETSMHAALPHAVVLHVHSVDAIAIAVRADAPALLESRLDDLRWAFVPYARPGLPLAQAIAAASGGGARDIFVLGNHGLVVAAPTVAAAAALLRQVVERLSAEPRAVPAGSSATWPIARGFHRPADPAIQMLATDPSSRLIAEGGVLYPDHAIFLGRAPLALDPGDDVAAALDQWAATGKAPPKWLLVRGVGVAVADDVARGGAEMLRCLADVAARIPPGSALSFLDERDITALTEWEAEKYRQQLAQPPN